MVKRYINKRRKEDLDRIRFHKNASSLNDSSSSTQLVRDSTSTTTTMTMTKKKLELSRKCLRGQSSHDYFLSCDNRKSAGSSEDEKDEDVSTTTETRENYDDVNLIVEMQLLVNLANRFCCPSCRRIGKISIKVTQRRGLLYHITFSCECSFETSICNSVPLNNPSSARMDELNMLACIGANVGGIKRRGMTQILGCLNTWIFYLQFK